MNKRGHRPADDLLLFNSRWRGGTEFCKAVGWLELFKLLIDIMASMVKNVLDGKNCY